MSAKNYDFAVQLIGLENSGKTTMLHVFKNTIKDVIIKPTVGFGIDTFNYSKSKKPIIVYDCSGEGRHRLQWQNFYSEVDAIFFLIDSTDRQRYPIVKKYLKELFKDERLIKNNTPIVILCNKQDVNGANEKEQIIEMIGLKNMI